jgi:hypothetical protein
MCKISVFLLARKIVQNDVHKNQYLSPILWDIQSNLTRHFGIDSLFIFIFYFGTLLCFYWLVILTLPTRGLPPYRAPQWPGELCWPECTLLVKAPVSGRSKGTGQTRCTPWSSRLGVGRGTNNPTLEKYTVTKLPEPMEEDQRGGQTHTGLQRQ